MNLFQKAIRRENDGRPPVWFMRQAGRYHSHYQLLKQKYSFVEICKKPEVACEAAMGPIRDFDFDASILFSDILFPLEEMGMGLEYNPGPKLSFHLKAPSDLKKLSTPKNAEGLAFQAKALKLLKNALPESKGLLGFVGAPLTLYSYAVEGSHKGSLDSAKQGMKDGRYVQFMDKLLPLLVENMKLQAASGPDTVAILDSCAGEYSLSDYREFVVPILRELIDQFKKQYDLPISYYAKGTDENYWKLIAELPVDYLGVDWNQNLASTLKNWSSRFAIQGNVDPNWMLEDKSTLEPKLKQVFEEVRALPVENRRGWICGLGHGILPKTPEENVKLFISMQREAFK